MKSSLFSRISRIVSANVNSLLDSVENSNPQALMKQAIEEVDQSIDDVREELAKAIATKHLASKQLVQKNNLHEELAQRIDLALNEGRDDLAKAAVSEQLDIEDQLPILEKTLHDCQGEEKELEGYLSALKAKAKEMRNDFNALLEIKEEGESTMAPHSDTERRVEKAETAFDQVFQTSSQLKGVSGRSGIQQKGKVQELESLERENRIKERLERYKG